MHTALRITLMIVSIILIISVLLQSSNSEGLSGSIAGGAEQLFGKKKTSPYEKLLKHITEVSAIAFIVLSVIIVTLFN
jgi:preprotein translocase subunit SecG